MDKNAVFCSKGQQELVPAVLAPDTGEAVFQDTAGKVPANYLADIGTEKPVLPLQKVYIDLLEGFEMALNALVVGCVLRITLI